MPSLSETKTISDACTLTVGVETTGPRGGDSGHGGRTEVTLKNSGGADMNVDVERTYPERADKITIRIGGDAELRVLAEALEWAAQRLRFAASS